MPDNRTRVPVSIITLEYYNGAGSSKSHLEIKRFNPSQDIWQQANKALLGWAKSAPVEADRSHRVEYSITYVDGYSFNSCYLLSYHHSTNSELAPDLSQHVRECAETFAGMRRPSHLNEVDYTHFLHALGRKSRELYTMLLSYYEISPSKETDFFPVELIEPLFCLPVNEASDILS
jgi:hypothetical protein